MTGTLSDGRFTVGDAVEVLPDGPGARIRGLQTHKRQVWNGEPGSRLAINLSGVGTDELHHGQVVVKPGTLRPTSLIDVSFRLLTDTPKPLRHNQLADLFVGAAEVPVHVRVLGQEAVQAGEEGWLQLRLDRPVVVVAGDRFILRQPSPSRTLGGGVVLSPHPRRRWRRFDDKVLSRFQTLARGAPDAILLQTLARLPFAAAAELIEQSDLDAGDGRAALSELRAADAVKTIGADADLLYVTLEGWTRLVDAVRATLQTYHAQSPLRRGMPRGEIRSRLQTLIGDRSLTTRDLNAVLAALQIEALVEGNDAHVWLADFSIALTLEQQAAIDQLLAQFGAAPYAPPNLPDSLRQLGHDEELLTFLIVDGRLVRLGGDVLLRSQDFQAMVERIQAHLRDHGSITLAETRDLFQTSRKYAQSVLEEMDARRITRREGDVRVLR